MARWNKRRRLIARWTVASTVVLLATMTWSLAGRVTDETVLPGDVPDGLTSVLSQPTDTTDSPIRFEDVTEEFGVTFRHFPDTRTSMLPEDMGSGVAVGDFDHDGYADLFFANIPHSIAPRSDDPSTSRTPTSVVYRNVEGRRFEDVTESSGLLFTGHAMGAAWADYDNDDDLDLYITAYGPNALFRNNGDGTFTEVTEAAGVRDARFSAGCSWSDYDRDGHLDLYVCNYVKFTPPKSSAGSALPRSLDASSRSSQYDTEQPYTLNPSAYAPLSNALFHNNGDGTFTDVAAIAGVADAAGKSLSAAWTDFDNDGWLDIYVANDVSNNALFKNNHDGTFSDVGPQSLAADYRGAMGIAIADLDRDLDQDLLVTHWIAQENALFKNMTHDEFINDPNHAVPWFMDNADLMGLGQLSLDSVGWATGFCDFDNDARPDLWIVNGSTLENPDDHTQLVPQPPFLFSNRDGRFTNVAPRAADILNTSFVGRGGAQVDIDRDGRVDWIIVRHSETPIILKNASPESGHWLRVQLRQTRRNLRAVGARVYLTADGQTQMSALGVSPSYLSQDEQVLHFGLADATTADRIRIVWPDGAEDDLPGPFNPDQELLFSHAPRYRD